jgi:uncharacterized protein (TIGR03437 family)
MRHHLTAFPAIAVFTAAVGLVHAQPQPPIIRPNSAVNAASHIFPGLPNYGVAQGSLLIVRGQGLASGTPQQFTSGNSPLQTTLAGASMQIAVAGAKVDVPMVYAVVGMFQDYIGSYDELAGIVLSTTPAGAGTITVTFNGRTSAPASITIVPSAFGIFTLNQSGVGPGVFTSPDLAVNTLTAARSLMGPFLPAPTFGGNSLIATAHPGDQLVVRGTGLGPISSDDAAPPPAGNLNVPVEVYVGGVKADVTSQGRAACCNGVDQIQFTVPPGIQGCYVPVAVKIGAIVSNFVTASISPDGSVCSDPIGWSTSDLQNGAPKNVAEISLARLILAISPFRESDPPKGPLTLPGAHSSVTPVNPLVFSLSLGSPAAMARTFLPPAAPRSPSRPTVTLPMVLSSISLFQVPALSKARSRPWMPAQP